MNDITPDIQHHLMQVYSALAMTVLAAAAGARISSSSILSGGGDWFWFTAIGMYLAVYCFFFCVCTATYFSFLFMCHSFLPGTFATLWYIQSTRHQINNTRYAALLLFGLLKGLTIGGLVANALIMDPGIVITAFLGSTTIFLCFSGVALIGKRREFLYLGGFLSSAILCLFVLSLANLFFRSAAIFTAELVSTPTLYACQRFALWINWLIFSFPSLTVPFVSPPPLPPTQQLVHWLDCLCWIRGL